MRACMDVLLCACTHTWTSVVVCYHSGVHETCDNVHSTNRSAHVRNGPCIITCIMLTANHRHQHPGAYVQLARKYNVHEGHAASQHPYIYKGFERAIQAIAAHQGNSCLVVRSWSPFLLSHDPNASAPPIM